MKEQLSTSAQKPKIELPNKKLVGVKKQKNLENIQERHLNLRVGDF